MFGYTSIYDKSMNGVKTLSDGISIISDGIAQHENIIYNEFIKSEDGQTQLTNNEIYTFNVTCENVYADNLVGDFMTAREVTAKKIKVVDNDGNEIFIGDGVNNKFTFNGLSDYYEPLTVINTVLNQTQGGYIYQTGTNYNRFKDSKINGYLEVGSNLTQTGGSTTLKDLTVDNINMNTNKGITQSGSGVSNTLGTSTITNLTITGSITFPSEVEIPGTTTSDDIIMNGSSVITQDTTVSTNKFNKLRYTKTLDLDIDGNLTQTKAGATATLKDTTIQGSTTLQGDIEQTAGFTKLNTIECNNITLRENNSLNISGTGIINQSGTGENVMNAIILNNNQNITFNGTGIISQPLNGTNILSHFRTAGFGIIAGRNNSTYTHYQNIQNNNGLQFQYNRDNSTFYSYFLSNRVGAGGGFRFQRYNGGVYVDEPLVIDDNITFNKDVNIVGKSISASSATLGIISQSELNCLDNCNINILTKFNNLDSQIASLQTTTGGVSTATTGISYNAGNDTTTIDNNLIVSSGKSLTLGSTNVNSFITDTNTFITAATNTLQGIVYTSNNDTTTINNNVSVTGNLLIQGLDVKAEIDALETSFTTGTLTTTTLTAGTLNITNQINMTNPIRNSRNINNIGFLKFCDYSASSDIESLRISVDNTNVYYNNIRNGGVHQFLGRNLSGIDNVNRLIILPDAGNGSYNPTTQNNDIVLTSVGSVINTRNLNLVSHSSTANGVRIEPTKTTMTGGTNTIETSSSGINIIGNNGNINITSNNNNKVIINSYDYNEETSKVSNVQLCNSVYSISQASSTTSNNNVLAYTITTNPRMKKKIIVSVPMSLSRSFRVNNTVIQWATVNESFKVSVNVFKNGVLHSTFNSTNTLNNTISLFTNQASTTFTYTYNYYCGSIIVSFTPDYNPTSNDTYQVYFTNTGTYTWETDTLLGFVNVQSLMTVNTTFNTFTSNSTVRISPTIPDFQNFQHITDYSISQTNPTTFTQINQPLVSNELITNKVNSTELISQTINSNTLSASTLTTSSINTSSITTNQINGINQPIHAWANIPCFYIDNNIANNVQLQEFTKPIYCSYKALGSNDDAFLVYPGYILVVYRYANYIILAGQRPWAGSDDVSAQTRTIDNSNGSSPIFIRSVDLYGFANQVQSCKVYYKSGSNEMTLPYYSYNV